MPNYSNLFDAMTIRAVMRRAVDAIVDRILAHRPQYEQIERATGVPWYVVAVIHYRESNLNFGTHLHNGDSLQARTHHVPAGRPIKGEPPFTFVESAIDALTYDHMGPIQDLRVSNLLHLIELYNGAGYIKKGMLSPYLWSFSNQYQAGKYVEDGKFSPTAVDQQCGAAPILLRLYERGEITLQGEPVTVVVKGSRALVRGYFLRGKNWITARALVEASGATISHVSLDPVAVTVAKGERSQAFAGHLVGNTAYLGAGDLAGFLGRAASYDAAKQILTIA